MNNFFITLPPYNTKKIPSIIKLFNRCVRSAGYYYALTRLPDPHVEMNSVEQRSNYYILLDSIISNKIDGDVVEIGCFTGQCAMLFQKIIDQHSSEKKLHLYDNFQSKFNINEDVENLLINNFKAAGLKSPILHKGFFADTLPSQLPDRISFVHVDCGFGGDAIQLKSIIIHCLEHIYPRMEKGAICAFMDYHDDKIVPAGIGFNSNPGVKLACDEFLLTRPETITSIYANQYSHGFFRKL
jgi:O-methyltransferase